jgi:hypothetical protein
LEARLGVNPAGIAPVTDIVARTPGDGAAKVRQLKALLEQAAEQRITGQGGGRIDFEITQGKDGSTIFLGGLGEGGARPAIVITPQGDVFSGASNLTGANGVTHFGFEYIPDYRRLKKN